MVMLFGVAECAETDKQPKELYLIAKVLDRHLPMQVDQNTIWSECASTANNTLSYTYKLRGVDIENMDRIKLISHLKAKASVNYRLNPTMERLRELKANLKYVYQNEDGKHLFDYVILYSDIANR